MPTIIDALTVELGLDPSGFTKGQKDAEDAFLKTKDHAVSTGKTIEASSKKAAESLQLIARQALALFAVLLGGRKLGRQHRPGPEVPESLWTGGGGDGRRFGVGNRLSSKTFCFVSGDEEG